MNTDELDLHGIKHLSVKNKIDKFLWYNMNNKKSQVKIITGNSIRMKEIVFECVKDYNMIVTESFFNPGILVVTM